MSRTGSGPSLRSTSGSTDAAHRASRTARTARPPPDNRGRTTGTAPTRTARCRRSADAPVVPAAGRRSRPNPWRRDATAEPPARPRSTRKPRTAEDAERTRRTTREILRRLELPGRVNPRRAAARNGTTARSGRWGGSGGRRARRPDRAVRQDGQGLERGTGLLRINDDILAVATKAAVETTRAAAAEAAIRIRISSSSDWPTDIDVGPSQHLESEDERRLARRLIS